MSSQYAINWWASNDYSQMLIIKLWQSCAWPPSLREICSVSTVITCQIRREANSLVLRASLCPPGRNGIHSVSKDLRYSSESQKEETRYPNVNSMCPRQKYWPSKLFAPLYKNSCHNMGRRVFFFFFFHQNVPEYDSRIFHYDPENTSLLQTRNLCAQIREKRENWSTRVESFTTEIDRRKRVGCQISQRKNSRN